MTALESLRDANAHYGAGRMAEAESACRRVLTLDGSSYSARAMLATILAITGRLPEALEQSSHAVRLQPRAPDAWSNHAYNLNQAGHHAEAIKAADQALALNPTMPHAAFNRAGALFNLGRFADCVAQYDALLAMQPDFPDIHNNRANALRSLGRLEEALAGHTRAVAQKPRDAEAVYNRAVTLKDMKRANEALSGFDRALVLRPDFPAALYARANALWELGRFEESLASADRLLSLQPDNPLALYARVNALWELKRLKDCLAAGLKLLAVAPDFPYALGSAANAALHLCDWTVLAHLRPKVNFAVRSGGTFIPPFTFAGLCDDPALLRRCAELSIAQRVPVMPPALAKGTYRNHDRIRIGYLSSDFQEHPVATQIAEVIEQHDRSRFEVAGLSTGRDDGGPTRKRLTHAFDQFHDFTGISDSAAAARIREMEIDILVDLGGHTHGTRLEILSHRPAPLQASWLGYPGTTGAGFIDYVIADPHIAPFAQQSFFSEQIVHLPHTYMPTDAGRRVQPPPGRLAMGLPEEGFVFCAFNKDWKITAEMFALWMRLLHAVPGSVLWLKREGKEAGENLRAAAAKAGVAPARLVFADRVENDFHLARQQLADLFVDTLPYNAHATACDALWVGMPVITCRGSAFAGRVAAGLLTAIGLPELVTDNLADYEALALALARDPARLKALKNKVSANRATTPLFNSAQFARNLETAFATMQANALAGEAPHSFAVPA